MSRRSSSRSQTSRKRKSTADVSENVEFEKSAFRSSKRHSTSTVSTKILLNQEIVPHEFATERISIDKNCPSIDHHHDDARTRLSPEVLTSTSSTSQPPTSLAPPRFSAPPPPPQDESSWETSFSSRPHTKPPLSSRRRRTIAADQSSRPHQPLTLHERNYLVCTPSRADYFTHHDTEQSAQKCPLPEFKWADSDEVWRLMLKKDRYYCRDGKLFDKHKALKPRMRSILFDWIIEVSEVYQLHRETFYLTMDFVDRYLSKISTPLQKQQLQLIGVTCLFIASKIEEIYPPRITEFAFVTDQACDIEEILSMEHIIIKVLDWDLAPVTVIAWLNLILQLSCHLSNNSTNSTPTTTTTTSTTSKFRKSTTNGTNGSHSKPIDTSLPTDLDKEVVKPSPAYHDCGNPFLQPIFSAFEYIQIARLLDLCMLDEKSLCFRYSILAASGYYLMSNVERRPLSDIGFEWSEISSCVAWMSPFATVLRSRGEISLTRFEGINHNHSHNIQTNVIDLDLLEEVRDRQALIESENSRLSPDLSFNSSVAMTPPASSTRRQSLSKPPVILDTVSESIEGINEDDDDGALSNNCNIATSVCL